MGRGCYRRLVTSDNPCSVDNGAKSRPGRCSIRASIGPPGTDYELEGATAAQPNRAEMTDVARSQAVHTQFFRQRKHRGVHQAQSKVGVLAIDVYRAVQ